jgi:iron complex outermembrane recepter protein
MRIDLLPVPGPGGLPVLASSFGDPAAATENFVDAEVGYRIEVGTAASIDVTGFAGRYDDLRTQELSAPVVQLAPSPRIVVHSRGANQLAATTRGVELSGNWMPLPAWRLDGSYTAFRVTPTLAPGSLDPNAGREDGSAPRTQWQVRSAFSVGQRASLNLAVFHVGALERLSVNAYTRTDINAEWRLTRRLAAVAIGQNLFDAAHREFAMPAYFLRATQVARSASVRLRWTWQ